MVLYASNGTTDWARGGGFDRPYEQGLADDPTADDGMIFAGQENASALDLMTGETVWSTSFGPKSSTQNTPAVTNDTVYYSTRSSDEGGQLYALNKTTGEVRWVRDVGRSLEQTSPVVADDVVYVAGDDCESETGCDGTVSPAGRLLAFDAGTGDHLWNYTLEDHPNNAPAVSNGTVYIAAYGNGDLLALSTDAKNTTTMPKELQGDINSKQYSAVVDESDTLSASNLADAINGWSVNGQVNSVEIGAFELSELINYWAEN
jgi:outer membrane protein assembly factor BamB